MSDRPTPETDNLIRNAKIADHPPTRLAATLTVKCGKLERERDEALELLASEKITRNHIIKRSVKVEQERDEAREAIQNLKLQLGLWEDGNLICEETFGEIRLLEERIEEAQKELSSIHRWIDKNHADGFIDSLTYLQNLERVTDSWYDRIDGIEADARRFVRERDEARGLLASEKITRDHIIKRGIEMQKERDEARKHLRDANRGAEINAHINQKFGQQIIDAREQIKELIYIAERAIDLAEIDFENDKFGVVSELRDDLAKIKKSK